MTRTHDNLYEVLSNVQRRQLLFALLEETPQSDSPKELETLPDARGTGEAERVEHRHVHLPKLDAYGFVDWSPETRRVERGPQFDEIRPALELLAAHHEGLPSAK
ncbi:hypothetical protein CV102_03290 [Natronococcus pandeyae]|uniref:ArsR family transcriptional regulator n=1 Tax=Natronococcus pandeyae TaxID=2055836 RepID=A0A8J8Q7N8_9EURY|nr:hypothetical protein CV102_03290 [Natronococcus pandeyae]